MSATLFALLFVMVAAWGVDLPYWDQWGMVPIFDRFQAGELTLDDLVPRHHGTGVATKIAMLLLGLLTGWNIRAELLLAVLLAGALWLVLRGQLLATCSHRPTRAVLGLFFALLVASPAQQENWAWGWKLETWLNVLAAMLALVLLGSGAPSLRRLLGALLCGAAASYTYINGVAVWPLGAAVLVLRRDLARKTRLVSSGIWLAATVVFASTHLAAYGYPISSIRQGHAGAGILDAIRYVGAFLGAPIAGTAAPIGLVAGVGLAGTSLLAAWLCANVRRLGTQRSPVWLAIAGYGVATACMTAAVRLSFGVDQALSSRYVTYANLLWIGLLGALASDLDARFASSGEAERRSRHLRLAAVAAIALAVPVALHVPRGVTLYRGQAFREEIRGSLRMGVIDEAQVRFLHPDRAVLEDHVHRLCRLRLSLFRYRRDLRVPAGADTCVATARASGERALPGVHWTSLEEEADREILLTARGFGATLRPGAVKGSARRTQQPPGAYCLAGWALDQRLRHPRPAPVVVVLVGDRVARATRPAQERPEIARRLGLAATARIGFRTCLDDRSRSLVEAGAELRAVAISSHGLASDLELEL